MINVFEKLAPRYQRIVKSYARMTWLDKGSQELDVRFMAHASKFSLEYQRELTRWYKRIGVKIYPGTIHTRAAQWLEDQEALQQTIKAIALSKKEVIKDDLISQLSKSPSIKTQRLIDNLYLTPKQRETQQVYKVFSFKDNFLRRANQLGEQAAFDLGSDINNAVISEVSTTYAWQSQEDSLVRKTHRKLNGKIFSFDSDPTTISRYGHVHTGPPGTDFGCRCYAVMKKGKPRLNFVVKA